MKSFKEYLKQIQEDKIIAKEDEGAAAPVGDVSAPSSGAPSSGEVITDTPKTDGGLTTADVLGKCDHKHDGFMGPGCFHRPYPIFSYPISRIKRKKRKYIKVLDLTESDEYTKFYPLAQALIEKIIEEANKYLAKTGSQCFYKEEYNFSGEKANWVSVIDYSNKDNQNNFGIAINLPVIYGFLEENSLENDQKELECQIKATIYHEIGHYLIKKFKDDEIYDFELTDDEEEKIVDEFTRFIMREYTGQTSSKLATFIDEMFENNISNVELNETDMNVKGNFFFSPINMKEPKRKVSTTPPPKEDLGRVLPNFKNVLVPTNEKIFSNQTNDYLVSLTNTGYLIIRSQADSSSDNNSSLIDSFDDLSKQYLNLPDEMKRMCLQVVSSPESTVYKRMDDNGSFPEELTDIWLNALDMSQEDREKTIEKFQNAQKQIEDDEIKKQKQNVTLYLRPTISDVVRIFHNKRETLPLDVLLKIEKTEFKNDYRYNEDEKDQESTDVISEEFNQQYFDELLTPEELCYFVRLRDKGDSKFTKGRPARWKAMTHQLGANLQEYENLGNIVAVIKYEDGSVDYICDGQANLIAINPRKYRSKFACETFYYLTPADVVYKIKQGILNLNNCKLIYPDNIKTLENVSIELLWKAVENVAYKRAMAYDD